MSSLILQRARVDVPFVTVNFQDDPANCPPITDFNPRATWVRSIILHTTHGLRGKVVPGMRASTAAAQLVKYQTQTERFVSWDFTAGRDGKVWQQNDPAVQYSWHATAWNRYSVGIEIEQDADGTLYAGQLAVVVQLVDVLTRAFGIQRQIPMRNGRAIPGVLARADDHGGDCGRSLVGVFGHHHNTTNRGEGDPGEAIFAALLDAGYEAMDFGADQDFALWRPRQAALGIPLAQCDGIAGPQTRGLLATAGHKHGLWVSRPGD